MGGPPREPGAGHRPGRGRDPAGGPGGSDITRRCQHFHPGLAACPTQARLCPATTPGTRGPQSPEHPPPPKAHGAPAGPRPNALCSPRPVASEPLSGSGSFLGNRADYGQNLPAPPRTPGRLHLPGARGGQMAEQGTTQVSSNGIQLSPWGRDPGGCLITGPVMDAGDT